MITLLLYALCILAFIGATTLILWIMTIMDATDRKNNHWDTDL